MPEDAHENSQDELVFEVTDMRPAARRHAGRLARLIDRRWRWAAVGAIMVLTLAVLLSGTGTTYEAMGAISQAFAPATPTFGARAAASANQRAAFTQVDGPLPTPFPNLASVPPVGAAPATCPGNAAELRKSTPPTLGQAVGRNPIWIDGFTGTFPTLSLSYLGTRSNRPFGWPLHYTQFGWPAPIALVLAPDEKMPVVISGVDPRNNQPLWLGLVPPNSGTAPVHISTSLTFDPSHPEVPAGGLNTQFTYWYGYIFLPREGCYALSVRTLAGDKADSIWSTMISAGR
jgi:hypothetical protein